MAKGLKPQTISSDSALGGKVIEKSLRFNGQNESTAPQLRRTGTTTSSSFSIAMWAKLSRVSDQYKMFFSIGQENDANAAWVAVQDGQNMGFQGGNGTYTTITRKFRDPTSWFHFLISVNSNNFTVYIDGTSVQTGTIRSLDTSTNGIRIGANYGSYYPWNGLLADVYLIDGQAKAPTDFGYTESQTGIWRPKKYTGTFGTGGAHLEFKDSSSVAALGKDTSGNGNDFTPTTDGFNVTAGVGNDSFTDTPTLNFPTLNALSPASSTSGTLSNGNLQVTKADYIMHRANFIFGPGGIQSGKWYWEVTNVNSSSSNYANYTGITGDLTQDAGEVALQANKSMLGSHFHKTYTATSGSDRSNDGTNKTMQFLLDVDNQQLIAKYNGSTIYTDTSIPSASTTNYVPFVMTTNSGTGGSTWSDSHFNFGQKDFVYSVPSGYNLINSKNLPPNVPSIIRPQRHFDVLTWTGNGSTGQNITGLEFKPDLLWIKKRNETESWGGYDSVRGVNKRLYINDSNTEETITTLSAFFHGGFRVEGSGGGPTNDNNDTYVGFCWKAGGATTVANTDGNQTTQVSVNEEAGLSIVTYTGTGSNTNIGHGLGGTPDIVITKSRSATGSWAFLDRIGNSTAEYGLFLNDNGGYSSYQGGTYWNDTLPTSTVFRVSSNAATNASGVTYVAYCWRSIPGYSKFGTYESNNSSDGPYVHLGFQPKWVMMKPVDSGGNWQIYDTTRTPVNKDDGNAVYADLTNSEASGFTMFDFLANGFKLKNTGSGGINYSGTYIYMAFA